MLVFSFGMVSSTKCLTGVLLIKLGYITEKQTLELKWGIPKLNKHLTLTKLKCGLKSSLISDLPLQFRPLEQNSDPVTSIQCGLAMPFEE